MKDWSTYGACPGCAVISGLPCQGPDGRELTRAHNGRPRYDPFDTTAMDQHLPEGGTAPVSYVDNAEAGQTNPGGKRRDDFADFPRGRGQRPKIIRAELVDGVWVVPTYKTGSSAGKPVQELVEFTRASTLGGALEYAGGLAKWKAAVAAWGIARNTGLAKRARAIEGYSRRDQKDELYEIVDKAQAYAESDSKANHGTALHSIFQRIAEGSTVDALHQAGAIDDDDVPAAIAFEDAITPWKVVWCERRVVCDEAQAAGKYDLIVEAVRPMPVTDRNGVVVDVILPGEKVVVDNKTSGTADFFGEKFAVQLWVYANGRDYDMKTGVRTEVGVNKRWALILHIPSASGFLEDGSPDPDGAPAGWYWVDLAKGATLVKTAMDVLEGRKLGKSAIIAADFAAEIPDEIMAKATLAATREHYDTHSTAAELATGDGHWEAAQGGDPDQEQHAAELERSRDRIKTVDYGPVTVGKEATVPGPDTTAPLPDGWESTEEQGGLDPHGIGPSTDLHAPSLAGKLQAAAALRKKEDALIRRVESAASVDVLVALHQNAVLHDLFTDRVRPYFSRRKQQLRPSGAH